MRRSPPHRPVVSVLVLDHRESCRTIPMLATVETGSPWGVSRNTMSFAILEELRGYIDQRAQSGDYGNTSGYLRDLIRRDRREQAALRLRSLNADGVDSGPLVRRRALGPVRRSEAGQHSATLGGRPDRAGCLLQRCWRTGPCEPVLRCSHRSDSLGRGHARHWVFGGGRVHRDSGVRRIGVEGFLRAWFYVDRHPDRRAVTVQACESKYTPSPV